MLRRIKVLLALIVVGSFALLAAACGEQPSGAMNTNATSGNQNANASGSPGSGDMDRQFMMEAAASGMAEVEMGRLAAQRAAGNEVKQFGQRMVDDHTRANNELRQLASRKNITLPTDLDPRHRETMQRLSGLSGAEFDRAYMEEMVRAHTKDVSDFERASNQAQDPDVRSFATAALPTLRQHLEMATSMQGGGGGVANSNGRAGNANVGGGNRNAPRGNGNARRGNANSP
jgi:putative membrane protein